MSHAPPPPPQGGDATARGRRPEGAGPGLRPPHGPRPRRTDPLAIWSLVLSLLVSVAGIVCGHIALARIRRTGEDGRGIALAGTIVGYVVTGLWGLVVVAVVSASLFVAPSSGAAPTAAPSTGDPADSVPPSEATIRVGYLADREDNGVSAAILRDQLTRIGYEVELVPVTDPYAMYMSAAAGNLDLLAGAWSEKAQADALEATGADLEDLGVFYRDARLGVAVPESAEVTSLEDLAAHADDFDGTIVGIERDSLLAEVTRSSVFPAYGLDGVYELHASSRAKMLAELHTALADGRDIAVTLWTPSAVVAESGLRFLDDPAEAFGDGEDIHYLGAEGFAERFPDAARLLGGATIDDATYAGVLGALPGGTVDDASRHAVASWLDEHPGSFRGQIG